MVPWQITLEPSQPGRAVSGGLLDRGPLELRLHAADELHHAQLEQHPDRGDCRQEAPNLFLLLPKFDKVCSAWSPTHASSYHSQCQSLLGNPGPKVNMPRCKLRAHPPPCCPCLPPLSVPEALPQLLGTLLGLGVWPSCVVPDVARDLKLAYCSQLSNQLFHLLPRWRQVQTGPGGDAWL